jgi:hypothetical protein
VVTRGERAINQTSHPADYTSQNLFLKEPHRIRNGHDVLSEPVAGGLHHEDRLVALA